MASAGEAWDRLRHLAKLLRARQPIPEDLADLVADAIEATADKPLPDRAKAKALTDELEVSATNRRRISIDIRDVRVERDFGDDASQNKFAARLAERYQVTPGTILNRLRDSDERIRREIEELSRSEGV